MNRGEGARIAAQAKTGKLGIYMFQEPKKKNKKFGYKGRQQQFTVRKHGPANEDQTQPQQLFKGASGKTAPPAKLNSKQVTSQQDSGGRAVKQTKDKSKTDFINKNKQIQSKKEVKPGSRPDTVTLTQDQLNAILQTIGSAGSGASAPSLAIENGKVKVNQDKLTRAGTGRDHEGTETNEREKAHNPPETHDGDEGISSTRVPNGQSGHDLNNNSTQQGVSGRAQGEPHGGSQERKTSPRGGQGQSQGQDLSSSIGGIGGFDNRSLAEKKRQQWKQELDAQVAEKKALQGKGNRGRGQSSDAVDTWNPWGQPGGGAPPQNYHAGERPSPRHIQTSGGQGSSSTLSQSVSGLGSYERQQNVPAAMRSSFVIGGPSALEVQSDVKRKEKEEWLRELEMQRREVKDKKDREKAKQRQLDSAGQQHWAEPVDPPQNRASRMESRVAQVQDDIGVKSRMGIEIREEPEKQQPKSAPHPSARGPPSDDDHENRMHIRPANTLVDPAEMERRDMQRKKHLEHMAAVKAQVEEKQRLKREADDRRRREEAESERRLREEQDRLAHDFEQERDKQRRKEETAAAKQRALAESMQNAQKEAAFAKHQLRMSKLQRQGHDVTNLRKSWDVEERSQGVGMSPGLPSQAITTQHLQQPQAATSLNFSPRVAQGPSVEAVQSATTGQYLAASVPHSIRDAATSPIHEVATQTDNDILDANFISPRLIEAIRLASAGAEFSPSKGSKHDNGTKKKMKTKQPEEESRRKESKAASKTSSGQDETPDLKGGESRRGSKAEKPKWGQAANATKKKLKNSDKDMSTSKKKREERLRKRQEEMLALQEKNAPKRMTQSKQAKAAEGRPPGAESKAAKSRSATRLSNHGEDVGSRRQPIAHQENVERTKGRDILVLRNHHETPVSSEDSYKTLPETPPLKSGDFIPFMRTEDEELQASLQSMTPSSGLASEELGRIQQIPTESESTAREEPETRYASRHSRQSHREMDPLLNPDRLKDKEVRQEQILLQLSNLRQGLLMKQREMEMGFSPSPVM